MATLREEIESKIETQFDWDHVFATVLVANDLNPDPLVLRGIVTVSLDTGELRSVYWGDVDQFVKEYENLPDFRIRETLDMSTALRRFVVTWPVHPILIGTNTSGWLKPVLSALGDQFDILTGRSVEVVDLGKLASANKVFQIRPADTLTGVLPPNQFVGKAGALHRLCEKVDVFRAQFSESVYAEARARMIAKAANKFLDKLLADD